MILQDYLSFDFMRCENCIWAFCVFFFHFIINILMTIGLFPVIGIPMILFSYGGSSLICASFGFSVIALILKDYRDYNRLGI